MTDGAARAAETPDAAARRRAATGFDRNLVVIAGAGTGKTSLLVERLLVAVGGGRASVTEVAAITFTEKAAEEMRHRLALGLERLRSLCEDRIESLESSREADRAYRHLVEEAGLAREDVAGRALEALRHLDRARVDTIHGFCAALLREQPLEAGVDPGFLVDEGGFLETVLEEMWEPFLQREFGPDAARTALWRRLLDRISLGDVREVAFSLADFGVPESLLRAGRAREPTRDLRAEIERCVRGVESILGRQSGMNENALTLMGSLAQALRSFERDGLEAFRRFVDSRPEISRRLDGTSLPSFGKGLAGVSEEEAAATTKDVLRLVRSLRRVDGDALADLVEAVAPFALDAREELLRRGRLTFDALLVMARNLLRDHPEVRERMKRRYRMLLVDEFQDTDPLQYEVVLLLAEREGGGAEDPYAADLEQGRLFIVGDPKQSIYRFRGADYSAFRRAVERVRETGGEILDLTANFRSVPGIVEPVNALFGAASRCWQESPYQPDYVPIAAVRVNGPERPRVEVWTVDTPRDAKAADRRDAEGSVIAESVLRFVEDERRFGYGKITVLLRAFSELPRYLRALRERDVPFVVDGGKDFLERPEVNQLLGILKAIARPSDAAALLAYLRSPAGGVTDDELARYGTAGGRWSWRAEVDADAFPRIAAAFSTLRNLAEENRDAPPDVLIRRVVEATGLLVLNAAAFEGSQRVANLLKVVAAASDLAREGRLSLVEVVDVLELGRTPEIESDSPLVDEATQAVRVMTVHKAKGLENDVIIVPDLAREAATNRSEKIEVRVYRAPSEGQRLALKVDRTVNLDRVLFEREHARHEEAEEVRVLYVALTRAQERLILLAGRGKHTSPWIESLRSWGYDVDAPPGDGETLGDGGVGHRVLRPSGVRGRPSKPLPETTHPAAEAYVRAVESVRATARPAFAAPSEEERRDGSRDEGRLRFRGRPGVGGDASRALGIVVHRLLERWDGRDGATLLAAVDPVASEVAADRIVDRSALVREATEVVEAFLGSELRARFARADILGREVPLLSSASDGTVYRGQIDLLFREEGEIRIADFKTDRDSDASRLRERHRGQLEIYAEAVRRALGLPHRPRAELWALRTGSCIVL